jgi:hypothetical protein
MYFIWKSNISIKSSHAEKNVSFTLERKLVFEIKVEFEFLFFFSFVDLSFLFFSFFFFLSLNSRLLTRNVRLMIVVSKINEVSIALRSWMIVTKNWSKYANWLFAELRSEKNAEALTRKEIIKRRINEKRIRRFSKPVLICLYFFLCQIQAHSIKLIDK